MSLIDLVYSPALDDWTEQAKTAFKTLYGASQGRYPSRAASIVTLRAPSPEIPFAALIHPSNPESGPYGGMSFVIFPVANTPSLLAMGVGTRGLSPDEEILGRPGHGRKIQAICGWLNNRHGNFVAWAKQDPVRTDLDLPDEVRRQFPLTKRLFGSMGK
jgi:5-methylcytosine-specific restriction protein B